MTYTVFLRKLESREHVPRKVRLVFGEGDVATFIVPLDVLALSAQDHGLTKSGGRHVA
jgi:hypothetical protein